MRPSRALGFTILVSTLVLQATPALGQDASEWRVGAGYLIARPGDARLWGVHAQREQRLTRLIIYRGVASIDGVALDPTLVTLSADVGVRAHLKPLSALIAVGPTFAYFMAPRRLSEMCQGGSCSTVQRGYEPGPLLAATGSLALGLRISSELRVFTEVRVHVPSRIGRSGFAQDPHAAFVERVFGVSLSR